MIHKLYIFHSPCGNALISGAVQFLLFLNYVILKQSMARGIYSYEKANKIMMPIFFVLFVVLGIYVAFQPGSAAGYRYIFRVEPEVLAKPSTWIFALGQADVSLPVQ